MNAMITCASSGIGRDMARILSEKGYDLILVARRKNRLEELKESLHTNVTIIPMDISSTYNCMKLYEKVKNENIEILINNAGFGLYGDFLSTSLEKELDMVDLNIKTTHILTKLFLNDFKARKHGYILNVASIAGFMPGPMMATYYATKSYIVRLTQALQYELKKEKSSCYVGLLCPGPVDTEFNKVADVSFSLSGMTSYDVARYAIKKMFKKKKMIIPGFKIKLLRKIMKVLPTSTIENIIYKTQKRR